VSGVSRGEVTTDEAERLCPSSTAAHATVFLGMITSGARVAYVTPNVPITPETVDVLVDDGGTLESQYRFAGGCVTHACGYWTGGHCGLGAEVAAQSPRVLAEDPALARLPRCGIRSRCRWFAEQGTAACHVCPLVVTDSRGAART